MNAATTIALISALISSTALVGVAVGLILQANQLRASQLQASRAGQAELIRISLENPDMASDALGWTDKEAFIKSNFMTLTFKSLEQQYSMGIMTDLGARREFALIFEARFPREWWNRVHSIVRDEAVTKRERNFFRIAHEEYCAATERLQPAENSHAAQPHGQTTIPASSSSQGASASVTE
jgi:hypothetical protein